jgi:hypothetical protein
MLPDEPTPALEPNAEDAAKVTGKHQKDGKDYVQSGGNPGQIGHGMVLGKAGENDITAPKDPSSPPPQTENLASTADASKLPD